MSLLLLDVGNSRLKWALATRDALGPVQAFAHGGEPAQAIAGIPLQSVEAVRIANVTGAVHAEAIAAAIRTRFGREPLFAQSAARHGELRSAYAEPQRLGVDRWLNLLAARRRTRGLVCIASAGTALTFDVVDASGQHLGGIIAPGLMTAQQGVLGATRFDAAGPDTAYGEGLGDDTEACVRQGALHACAGLVDRLARRYPQALLLLLTGGDADVLRGHLESPHWQPAPDLVLEGLLALHAD